MDYAKILNRVIKDAKVKYEKIVLTIFQMIQKNYGK